MTQQVINVGTIPNDGTGDPLRDAMVKINANFTEIYTNSPSSNAVLIGNSSVNSAINSTAFTFSDLTQGAGLTLNTTGLYTGNATSSTTGTGSTIANDTIIFIGNSSINTSITTTSFRNGNATAYFIANTTGTYQASQTFTLGSSNTTSTAATSNGYARMPNGLLMQWGTMLTANSTAQVVVFSTATGVAFATNCYSVTAVANTAGYSPAVYAVNSTSFTVVTTNATAGAVSWMAIGK